MDQISGAVVVGYDESPESEKAVRWASHEAVRRGRDLVVVFAYDLDLWVSPHIVQAWTPQSAEVIAKDIVATGVSLAQNLEPSLTVHGQTSVRGPASALIWMSQDADLLVLGGGRHGRVTGALIGSVAFAVSARADCPVVVVPADAAEQPAQGSRVVVGLDGSAGSEHALAAATDLAADTGAELVLIGAWETPTEDHWSRIYLADDTWRHEIIEAARSSAEASVAAARAQVEAEHPHLSIREVVAEGRPATVLGQESEGASLVVVGARGRGDLRSLLMGSVSRAVMHDAHCPVYIVR